MCPHHRVGGPGIAAVEQLAGDEAALDPPFVPVGEHHRVAGDAGHHLGGLLGLAGVAQVLGAGEQVGRVAAQSGRHRLEQLAGRSGFGHHRDAGLDQSGVIRAGPLGGAARRLPALLEKSALHPVAMVLPGQDGPESLHELHLDILPEDVGAPSVAYDRGRILGQAVGREGLRQSKLAGRRQRTLGGEEGAHRRCGAPLGDHGFLGPAAGHGAAGEVGIAAQEGDDAVEADRRAAEAQGQPLRHAAGRRFGQGGAHGIAAGDVAAAVQVEGLPQQRGLAAAGFRLPGRLRGVRQSVGESLKRRVLRLRAFDPLLCLRLRNRAREIRPRERRQDQHGLDRGRLAGRSQGNSLGGPMPRRLPGFRDGRPRRDGKDQARQDKAGRSRCETGGGGACGHGVQARHQAEATVREVLTPGEPERPGGLRSHRARPMSSRRVPFTASRVRQGKRRRWVGACSA